MHSLVYLYLGEILFKLEFVPALACLANDHLYLCCAAGQGCDTADVGSTQ